MDLPEVPSLRWQVSQALMLVLLLRLSGEAAWASLDRFWRFSFLELDECHVAWTLPRADAAGRVVRYAMWNECHGRFWCHFGELSWAGG